MTRISQSAQVDASFVNNFWGNDDPGLPIIQARMQNGYQTLEELLSFYHERLVIEKEYNKKLELLSKKYVGSTEIGTLKNSLDRFLLENNNMISYNKKFIKSLSGTNYEALSNFNRSYRSRKTKIEEKMTHIRNKKLKAFEELNHCKSKFQNDCGKLKSINLQNQTLLGRELEKSQAKAIRMKNLLFTTRKDYELAITKYKDLHEQYIRDWIVASSDLENLDEERIDFLKQNLCKYSNNIATLCVDNDQAVDNVRQSLAMINPGQDTADFTINYGTGNRIYNSPNFINFLDGQDERDFGYQIANFEKKPYQINHDFGSTPNFGNHENNYIHNDHLKDNQINPNQYHQDNVQEIYGNRLPHDKSLPQFPPLQQHENLILHTNKSRKQPSQATNELEDQDEVFSNPSRFRSSENSTYSNPTSLSNYSNDSNGERTWSSPRKKYKELQKFQEEINSKVSQTSNKKPLQTNNSLDQPNKKVPIIKDFSIDFIAKCLEDLNKGGDGDVSQYRKSVRKSKARSEPSTPFKPVNFDNLTSADDADEIATPFQPSSHRNQSSVDIARPTGGTNTAINGSPSRGRNRRQSMYNDEYDNPYRKERGRPKSMVIESEHSNGVIGGTVFSNNRRVSRSLSRGATKTTYRDLNRVLTADDNSLTPSGRPYIVKAKAMFSFKPVSRGELAFKKNAKMFVLNKQSDGWYKCELLKTGDIGLVPNNYIHEGDFF